MQLISLFLIALVFFLSESLFSEQKVTTTVMSYTDETDADILQAIVLYETDLSSKTDITLEYGIDAVTSASFDSASEASAIEHGHKLSPTILKSEQEEDDDDEGDYDDDEGNTGKETKVRHSVNMTLTHKLNEVLSSTSSFAGSVKSDYESVTLGQSMTLTVGSKNTLAIGGYFTSNHNTPEIATTNVYMRPPEGKDIDSTRWSGLVSAERIISSTLKFKIMSEFFRSEGYQSTGYQRLPITNSTETEFALEVLPDYRNGWAITTIISKWLPFGGAFHLRNRYYKDSYDISAFSTDISLPFYLSDTWIITPRYRLYSQTKARFWIEDSETVPTGQFTNHYSLGDISSQQIGLGVSKDYEYATSTNYFYGTIYANYDYYKADFGFYFHSISLGLDINF